MIVFGNEDISCWLNCIQQLTNWHKSTDLCSWPELWQRRIIACHKKNSQWHLSHRWSISVIHRTWLYKILFYKCNRLFTSISKSSCTPLQVASTFFICAMLFLPFADAYSNRTRPPLFGTLKKYLDQRLHFLITFLFLFLTEETPYSFRSLYTASLIHHDDSHSWRK